MASKENFWMYDVTQLFRSYELLPSPEDSLSTKLNTITRLALIVCVVIAAYKPVLAFSTLVIVMVVTMSVYSGAVADPTVERFEVPADDVITASERKQLYEFMREYNSVRYPDLNAVGFPTTQKRFCDDAVPLEYGPNHISPNQALVGGPNPKTRISPLIVAPSHDLDSWRNNDFVVHSQINRETNFDADRAGYNCGILPTKCGECVYVPCQCKSDSLPDVTVNGDLIEGLNGSTESDGASSFSLPQGDFRKGGIWHARTKRNSRRSGYPDPTQRKHKQQYIKEAINELKGKHDKPYIRRYVRNVFMDRHLGDVNDLEIDEVLDNINIMSPTLQEDKKELITPCYESPRRDNIITQTLQPGVFQKSHIGEPIQNNIGISYTQQWGPTEVQQTNNMIKYTMHDPNNTITTPQMKEEPIAQNHGNIYDPRFTGYGTGYRSYVDQLTGRPKFFYDDVDAVTMPNYITRSNVDVFPWANTYGPDKIMTQSENNEYKQLANNAFTDSTITFRTEMQERLMRKRNAELWQRRVAPISTMGRLGSSMKSCL